MNIYHFKKLLCKSWQTNATTTDSKLDCTKVLCMLWCCEQLVPDTAKLIAGCCQLATLTAWSQCHCRLFSYTNVVCIINYMLSLLFYSESFLMIDVIIFHNIANTDVVRKVTNKWWWPNTIPSLSRCTNVMENIHKDWHTSGGRPKSFSSSTFLHACSRTDHIQKYVALEGRLTALWT